MTWQEKVEHGPTCIAGLGGGFGDDGLGWWIVEELRKAVPRFMMSRLRLAHAVTPADLLASLEGTRELLVIDACQGVGKAGEIRKMRWPKTEIVALRHQWGHNVSLPEVLELAANLGQLPDVCEIWCIEGSRFGFGQALSAPVQASASQLVKEILNRLDT